MFFFFFFFLQIAAMNYDGTPVSSHDKHTILISTVFTDLRAGTKLEPPQRKSPVDGMVQIDIPIGPTVSSVEITVG